MRSLNDLLSEDTNQFGPGTDLVIALLAVLLVIVLISARLYSKEKIRNTQFAADGKLKQEALDQANEKLAKNSQGKFKLATSSFSAGDFLINPATEFRNRSEANAKVATIIAEYEKIQSDYPYIFIIGHANQIDVKGTSDNGPLARQKRNWDFAGRRAVEVGGMLGAHLSLLQQDKLVIVSAGEFDLKLPASPDSQENAWVEVVFGKEWKLPARESQSDQRK
ncbi:MAG: hypothetical protein HY231_03450 [Acidobacteria bacterium]|nr:hypothetical protein [Acidobacteriota bacterium]